ncbi:MAG: rhomboid family intramembrane serine protease, partial [Planctomycetes bacterium]|nr:rhomboid family intramembrane serine protease [Planctomycetota bacterium]
GLAAAFEYDRERPWQLWRWLTCHFAHFDGGQLFWSGGVFVAFAAWLEPHGRARLLAVLGVAAIAIPAAVAAFAPGLATYRGLSGLDSALFVLALAGVLRDALVSGRRGALATAALFGLAFLAKLAWEVAFGAAVFARSGAFVPVPLAHAVGAAIGLVAELTTRLQSTVSCRRRNAAVRPQRSNQSAARMRCSDSG